MQKHKAWLLYAHDDLAIAKLILISPNIGISSALFHAQQCAEKALKAYLIFNSTQIPRTHDLIKLTLACVKLDIEFESILTLAAELNPYSTQVRYPEDYYSMLHTTIAEQAILCASQIYVFAEIKISSALTSNIPKKRSRKHA